MILFLILLAGTVLWKSKAAKKGEFFLDYMDKERTTAINGIFALLIFLSHASGYLKLTGPLDAPYLSIRIYLDQAIVVPFFFYSGYGIMESIKRRGMSYVKGIPFRRFFRVFSHMCLAVLLYAAVNLILGKKLKSLDVLLAFPGWTSIGNSGWYVFAILSLYLIVFVSFLLSRGNVYFGAALTMALSILFVFWQMRIDRDPWTYNTVILFPAGMLFSLGKPLFERVMAKNDALACTAFAGLLVVYLFFDARRNAGIKCYSLWAIFFMLLIVTLTLKFSVGNHILRWFGSHVFSFYILQRIPFMILSHFGCQSRPLLFTAVSFFFTVALAALFDFATGKLDNLLYSRQSARPQTGGAE